MKTNIIEKQNGNIALIEDYPSIIFNGQDGLEFLVNVQYATNCNKIAVNKNIFCEDFFDLSSKIAGDILQKVINYHFKIAIIGDYSKYKSKALADFIYECNNGNDIFFVSTQTEAEVMLEKAN